MFVRATPLISCHALNGNFARQKIYCWVKRRSVLRNSLPMAPPLVQKKMIELNSTKWMTQVLHMTRDEFNIPMNMARDVFHFVNIKWKIFKHVQLFKFKNSTTSFKATLLIQKEVQVPVKNIAIKIFNFISMSTYTFQRSGGHSPPFFSISEAFKKNKITLY